jgi:Xaa-Pro aminopeptidase
MPADLPHARDRQRLLVDLMRRRRLDAVVLGRPEHVYWATGHWPAHRQHESACLVRADGHVTLFTANETDESATAHDRVPFEANWHGTARQDQPFTVALLLASRLNRLTFGIDGNAVTAALITLLTDPPPVESIDADLHQLRRSKWPDELAIIRRGVRCMEAMYACAREIIRPGLAELDLYGELVAAAVKSAGEPLSGLLGNDYACGVPGGPARLGHAARAGQLWVLDLGPAVSGYNVDSCRTFSVDGKPTDIQRSTHAALCGVFPLIEPMVRPGVRCRDLYEAADDHLRSTLGKGLPHHLGHGVGLQPHEFPHLNQKWDDVMIEGDVFTLEPGAYGPELNGGIRVENQYLVTKDGVENLLSFPLEL